MLAKLSELMFAGTLRRYVRMLTLEQTGWMAAARDPEVGKALTLLHHRHGESWTVAALAQEVGLSRTVFAEQFRHFLGLSPMAYLTRWRLQIGARSLTSTSWGVAEVAAEVDINRKLPSIEPSSVSTANRPRDTARRKRLQENLSKVARRRSFTISLHD